MYRYQVINSEKEYSDFIYYKNGKVPELPSFPFIVFEIGVGGGICGEGYVYRCYPFRGDPKPLIGVLDFVSGLDRL